MRILYLLISVFIVASCTSKTEKKKEKFPDDLKLLTSWQSFKDALNRLDTTKLISLSNSCIMCTLCSSEQTTPEKFYQDHLTTVFNSRLLSFLNDSTKLSAAFQNTTVLEPDSCIWINNNLENPKFANVL